MAHLKDEIELEFTMSLLNEFHNLMVLGKNDCWYLVERAGAVVNNNVDYPFNPMTYRQPYYPHRHVNSSALVV